MAYLDCSVKSCTYNNEDGCCCKGDIQVEGREATEAQSTCCGSFKDRGTNGAACNALKDVSKEIDVAYHLLGTAQQFKSFFIVILPMVEGAGIDAAFHCLGILVLRGKGIVGLQE